ncbi:MAG: DUF4199 domain-containing protein [Bacteroidetes bacterium]|nr:MAG: DUF4199 domain-containing protein [Bacteroidota bacterium]TAE59095.1 MAG: DUF4199 domain-containing protein [Bacteroidota bacterium]TAF95724.1 MAG: DUF4199 domain-containing protein [Bacteroidota bacterium]
MEQNTPENFSTENVNDAQATATVVATPSVNLINEGVKYGVILGALSTLILYAVYFADSTSLKLFTNLQLVITFVPFMFAILLAVGFQIRKQNGGILTFQEGLKFSFLSYAVAALIVAVSTYILYNLIDKDLTEKTFAIGMEKTQSFMEKMGAKEEDIEKALSDARNKKPTSGIKDIAIGTGTGLIWDFIKACIIALIIKKEKPAFGGAQ